MRVKQVLSMVPLPIPANVRLVYSRIASSRLTTAFFILSFLHFILQVSFQAWAFQINASAGAFLSDILTAGNLAPRSVFAVLVPLASDGQSGGELHLCNTTELQAHEDIYQCPVVWKGRSSQSVNGSTVTYAASASTSPSTSTSGITPINTSNPGATGGAAFIPKEDVFVVGVTSGEDSSDDPQVDSSDDSSQSSDRRRSLQARYHDLSKVPRLSPWRRRNIPVESVYNTSLIQAGSAAMQTQLVGVRLPDMVNVTTGTKGVVLSEQCVQMIAWPNQIIHNTKREDLTFIGFQLWVFGMSTVAILNESIPHTLAALATHVLATAWSGYQLVNTASFQSEFVRSTIKSGLCGNSVNLLPTYWVERRAAEVTVLVVNVVSLLISAALSWRLVKMFGWQTFKRIGASLEINRVYKLVLTFSIGLQVAFFFIFAAVALWLDVLFATVLGANAEYVQVYKTFGILTCLLMVPWLCLGWFAVRRETQKLMCAFLGACIILISAWGFLFVSRTFRWEFTEWRFFGVMVAASAALTLFTTILGVICFYNFDKGLKRFLSKNEADTFDRDNFTKVVSRDMEKAEIVDFPVSGPIPTYAVAFGNTTKVSPTSQSSMDRSNSMRSLESTSSAGLGSPLHDPVFFDPAPDYPYLQAPGNSLPPRFRSPGNSINEINGSIVSSGNAVSVDRVDSTTSTDSGSNPFSLDTDRRHSAGSGFSGETYGTNKSARPYAKPGSNFAPTIMSKHVRDESQASSRRWVID